MRKQKKIKKRNGAKGNEGGGDRSKDFLTMFPQCYR